MSDSDDDHDELEQHAGDLADQVFLRHAVRTGVCMVLTLLVWLIVDLGLTVIAVLTLPVLPLAATIGLGLVLAVDLGWQLLALVRHLRRNPLGRDRGLSRGDRAARNAQRARIAQAELRADTWPNRLRSPIWWRRQATTIIYLGCLAILVTHWTANAVLGVGTAILTATIIPLIRRLLRTSTLTMTGLAQFCDLAAPKPTPEI